LIPSKDHKEDLELLLSSLHERSSYRAFEVIVIENNSTDPETFTYYEEAKKKYPWLRVIVWESGFNYAAINNFGAAHAKGDYLLFMNNDMELKSPDLLTEMLGYCQEADVGMVGARLLYPDDTIQHAGVFIGMSGLADHGFQGFSGHETGYHYRPLMAQELSAVTAACLMMKKETFFQVEGFDEAYRVAFNDTDLCMKVRAAGLSVVYTPEAVMYHYESKSRGLEDTPEKKARLKGEVDRFKEKWPEILENGDPFYNPNLTTKKQDFSLK
ncbi:MAG: glycosyltransferase family 2 protein, partial [Lachnospiraceae bacterium]|nr:glycosyltransferase family 2 protein [Lachnospiraceae bacterium]